MVTGVDPDGDFLLQSTDSSGLAGKALVLMSDVEYLSGDPTEEPEQPGQDDPQEDGGDENKDGNEEDDGNPDPEPEPDPEEPACTGAADCPAKTHNPGCLSQQPSHTYWGYPAKIITLAGTSAAVRRAETAVAVNDLAQLPSVSTDAAAMTVEQTYESSLFSGLSAGDTVLLVFDETGTLVMVAWLSSEPARPTEPTEPTGPTQPTEPTDPTAPTQPGGGQSGGFSGGGGASFGGGQQTQSSFTLYSLEKITVASVTSQAHMTLEITVDELDITKVQPGQSASVTLDALPGERFEATVSQVAASGTNEGGSSKFTVELALEKDSQVLPGMQASAFLTLDTAQNVLCVPAAALGEENGEPVLYTALDPDTGTPTAPLSVTLGTADADYTQILTPLPSDTTIYYPYYE